MAGWARPGEVVRIGFEPEPIKLPVFTTPIPLPVHAPLPERELVPLRRQAPQR